MGPVVPLPSREKMLAAELPVEVHSMSRVGGRQLEVIGRVVRRHATEVDRDSFGSAEREAMR